MPFVLLGAGGHAKVLLALLRAIGAEVVGVCDPGLQAASDWRGVRVLGDDAALDSLPPDRVALVNAIGQVVGSPRRMEVFEHFSARGYRFPALVHPAAWVDESVVVHEGAQIMAGAVIQPDTVIGANSVINTGARVDHDCIIASHVHIAPAAVLCGGVSIAAGTFVGAGATVIQGISIGEHAVVGAGSTVIRNLPAGHVLVGSPVRKHLPGKQV
ncbi:acetyltransferase [Pseudomonas farsensis]|uniref:Acetyltransferase n=1 Tax=Pseudomonas farsensis TaxID=2745492 RepID=A0ABU8QTZ0_9PSED